MPRGSTANFSTATLENRRPSGLLAGGGSTHFRKQHQKLPVLGQRLLPPKGRTPFTLHPFGRLFILANDEDKDLLVLPDTTPDMADKLHIFRCNPADSPMPTSTDAGRAAYCAAIAEELPHLVADLEDWEVPEHLRQTRTGVRSYLNPVCFRKLQHNNPELILAELMQAAISASVLVADEGRIWRGRPLN